MNRKQFLRNSFVLAPLLSGIGSLVSSCKKEENSCNQSFAGKVIVVGAGEASNTKGSIGTVHGAIESAIDAVENLLCS